MESEISITKIKTQDKILYIKVQWKESEDVGFQIQIFDGTNTWSGRYSREFAMEFIHRMDQSVDDYRKDVRKALLGESQEFCYDFMLITGETLSAKFSWKKIVEDGARIVHGSVPVHLDGSPEPKDILIDCLLKENQQLRKSISKMEESNRGLSTDLDECKMKLESFVDLKTSLESSLYGKFVQLLNSKKRRIQLLEENLQKFEPSILENELD